MRTSWGLLFVLTAACGAGDDTATGSHSRCAEGGAINDCTDAVETPEDACWRLVDCAAIPVKSGDKDNHFDWGACVDRIEQAIDVEQNLIVDCIAASSCDALKAPGSPDNPDVGQMACFQLGGR
ncbi:MAG: hypothetical protein QM831_46580 [Kofleriaceae bacterium]